MASGLGSPGFGKVGVPLALLVVAALGYGRVLDAPFVFDDVRNVVENEAVRWEQIGPREVRRAVLESPTPRPVSNLSFGLHHALGGSPRSFRLTNVAIHVANGLWIFALALGTCRRASRLPGANPGLSDASVAGGLAFLAALLFVAHPIQTQAVTYAVQRMTSLATFFTLAAVWLWLRGGEAENGGARWRAAAVASWIVALGAKEIAIVLPFALWLYEACFRRDYEPRWCARTLPPLLLAGLAGLGLGLLATDGLAGYSSQPFSLVERLWSAPRVFWLYASLVALPLPSRQNLLHDVAASTAWNVPPTTALALVALVLAAGVAFALRRRARFASFAFAWFALHLALESTFLPLALVFEHRVYLPLAGVAMALPPVLHAVTGSLRATLAVGLAIVALLTSATALRNEIWRDPLSLWRDTVAKSPGSGRAHDELGLVLVAGGEIEAAAERFARAAALDPTRPEPWAHLGWTFELRGERDAAGQAYREAIRVDPDYPRAYYALGRDALARDDVAGAIAQLERAVALSPRDAAMRAALGAALARGGRMDEARTQWEAALDIDRRRADANAQLGELALRESRETDALRYLETAVAGAPHLPAPRNNLAWLLATSRDAAIRDPARAVSIAEALRAEGGEDEPAILDTLAAAHAASGRHIEAARLARRAAELAEALGQDATAARMRARAAAYEKKREASSAGGR